MATTFAEAADIWLRSNEEPNGYYITGCYPALLADRISYAFNFKGPSCVFDSACSASFSALQYAILALKSGLCDSAIVGGANINLLPLISEAFFNFRAISADGKCKVFDANCDGFVRSEAVAALYICRKDHAKRSYARIAGIKCLNDGYKPEGISVPSAQMQEQLIKEVYAEAKKNPLDVFYVEAHGTGTKAGDPKEIEALDSVFCTGRKEPFFVGSVKTNMGHAEPASGLCAIIKVLLSRRAGTIPPSLHFQTPNPKCQALVGGRIQVVTEPTTFKGNLVGVNCFGIGGTSAHAILEFDDTELQQQLKKHSDHERLPILKAECTSDIHFTTEAIPTFIPASGRTKDAVEYFLAQAVKNSNNAEFVGLIQNIARTYVPRHDFGGYALITSTGDFEIEISAKTGTKYSINLTTEEFYTGHVVQEQILFPATGYIWLVWKAFARLQFLNPEELPIQLENLNFTRVTELHPKCSSNFIVSIFIESGNFEIVESKEIVCTGTIQMINNVNDDKITTGSFANSDDETLDHEDFYKLLRLKGYNYQGLFRGVQSIEREGTWAKLEWKDNWICFLDTILQTQILEFNISLKDLVVPIRLESCTIDPIRFKKSLNENTNTVTLKQCKHSKVVRCPGIQLSGFKVSSILFYNSSAAPTFTVQKFLPYIDPSPVTRSKQEVLEFFIGIVVENSHGITNKPFILTEILKESVPIDPLPSLLYLKFPSFEHRVIQPKFDKYCGRKLTLTNLEVFDSITDVKSLTRGHLVKIENEEDMSGCMDLLQDNGFIALCTPHENITSNLIVVAKKRTENEYIYLLRKGYSSPFSTTIVSIDMPDYDWIE
ncbi:unnamed protein product, partial [Allacma fusca]